MLATRALNIFPLAWLLNKREHKPAPCVTCPACRPCSQTACIHTLHSHVEIITALLQQLVTQGRTAQSKLWLSKHLYRQACELRAIVLAGRKLPLPHNLQTVLWACGLRGAVAYGLAVNLPQAGLSDSWTRLLHSLSIFAFFATAHMHTSAAAYCVDVQAVRVGPLLTVTSSVLQIDAESDEGIPAIESATLVIVLVSTLLFGGLTGKPWSACRPPASAIVSAFLCMTALPSLPMQAMQS